MIANLTQILNLVLKSMKFLTKILIFTSFAPLIPKKSRRELPAAPCSYQNIGAGKCGALWNTAANSRCRLKVDEQKNVRQSRCKAPTHAKLNISAYFVATEAGDKTPKMRPKNISAVQTSVVQEETKEKAITNKRTTWGEADLAMRMASAWRMLRKRRREPSPRRIVSVPCQKVGNFSNFL